METFAAAFKKVQKINKAVIGAVLFLMIGVVFYRHSADLSSLRA